MREAPVVGVEAACLRPDLLVDRSRSEIEALELWHGNQRARLGDFFALRGAAGAEDRIVVEGDLRAFNDVGAHMQHGALTIVGDLGHRVGAGMRGGELVVEGDVRNLAGTGMVGGRLTVRGSAGDRLGAGREGERAGMRGGEIIVHGDAGAMTGAALRRGLIAVAGEIGELAGLRMLAGTIVALGGLGHRPGAGMRRGTLVAPRAHGLLPTFALACSFKPAFVRLYLNHLRALGLGVEDRMVDGVYQRWCGDATELRRGEILLLEESL